jgi:hypothetical protein
MIVSFHQQVVKVIPVHPYQKRILIISLVVTIVSYQLMIHQRVAPPAMNMVQVIMAFV